MLPFIFENFGWRFWPSLKGRVEMWHGKSSDNAQAWSLLLEPPPQD
jgi:hypothetical protein